MKNMGLVTECSYRGYDYMIESVIDGTYAWYFRDNIPTRFDSYSEADSDAKDAIDHQCIIDAEDSDDIPF